jgi:hypothetical protein
MAVSLIAVMASCDIMVVEPRYDYRDQMVGYYDMEEYSETYNDYTYYSVRISKDTYSRRTIYLNNFYGANVQVYAYVDYSKITIPYQVVNGYEIEGVGTLQGSDLSLNYRVKDLYHHSVSDFCNTWGERDW